MPIGSITKRHLNNNAGAMHRAESWLPWLRAIAHRIHRHLPPWIDREHLVQAGIVGLRAALRSYDPARSEDFGRLAALQVRWAMLDFLHQQDILSADEWNRLRELVAERNSNSMGEKS